MVCPNCGRRNSGGARYCIHCGRPLSATQGTTRLDGEPTRPRPRRSTRGLVIAMLAAAAIVLALLFVALWAVLGQPQPSPSPPDVPTALVLPPNATLVVLAPTFTATATTAPQQTMPPTMPPPPAATRTPRAAPTSSPAPTATPPPAEESAPASPTPPPTKKPTTPSATPRPTTASCRPAASDLIAFKRQKRCDKRTGNACGAVEIWIMNADGSNQAPMCSPSVYDRALVRDRTSPDGSWRVEVSSQKKDIIRVYQSGQWEWLIINNRADWDPVLSADGWWLAWVTNRNGNDEIYIKTLDPKDQNQRRLTENEWEWDKHPTWSPDGRKIAFYSNRADKLSEATRQIWVMEVVNDRGTNLRNLSNQPDQVDTDPVWFKWDDMP